jgi:hypothetical protein
MQLPPKRLIFQSSIAFTRILAVVEVTKDVAIQEFQQGRLAASNPLFAVTEGELHVAEAESKQ